LTLFANFEVRAEVHRRRGVQSDARVSVDVVVVIEENVAEDARVFNAAEAIGKRRAVLERLERRLGERVVVRDVRSRVTSVTPKSIIS
jgi:hypothetical protein